MKSKLFVPASRPELFGKALASDADALSFDLEDAVPEARKAEARDILRAFLGAGVATRKTLIVRVNALGSPHFEADLDACVHPGVGLINLPKLASPADVVAAAEALGCAERRHGVTSPIGLLLTIESPAALRQALALAQAHPRVAGLQLGLADLFEPLGIARDEPVAVQQAMFALSMAAGEAGVYAVDAAFADVGDAAAFEAEARLARNLGFVGKSCIHPAQVALANEIFRPTSDELNRARRVVAAQAQAGARGLGAWMIDGRMVDPPFIQRARALVAAADGGVRQ
jgi:citrate lyase subunit beta/citryl-CoA lyase